MYNKNELSIVDKPCNENFDEDFDCDNYDHIHKIYDSSLDCIYPTMYLPHSCDEWVIGGIKEARLLIKDLQLAIKEIERI